MTILYNILNISAITNQLIICNQLKTYKTNIKLIDHTIKLTSPLDIWFMNY